MRKFLTTLALFVLLCSFTQAADWPAWRGPSGQGFCEEKNILLKWNGKGNAKWKVPLVDPGNSTPVIWGSRIFLTQANKGGSKRSLLCFARADGKLLWQKDVMFAGKERNWNESWYCNASPATDGERVLVSFASAGMYCFDVNGTEQWKRTDLGEWQHAFGSGSSPVLYGDLAILWCGPNETKGRNFLLAVNKKTGTTVWDHDEKEGSWGTPLITKIDGRDQMLLGVGPHLKSFDPKTGKELWRCDGLQSYVYTSALYGNGVAVGMSGYGRSSLAVKTGGTGDITADRLWMHPRPATQRVGSGMIVGDHLYMVDEGAVAHCYELKSGEDLWKNVPRLRGGSTWGSMVHAEGRIYLLMRNAETVVLAANPKHEVLAVNPLEPGEYTNSSLAISNGEIFIRTFRHLWCITDKK